MIKRMCSVLLLLGLLVLCQGCAYRYNYVTGKPASDKKITMWRHHLLWGCVNPGDPVDLDSISPEGVARFGSYESFANWLCTFVTIGFYAPETVYVIPAKSAENVAAK